MKTLQPKKFKTYQSNLEQKPKETVSHKKEQNTNKSLTSWEETKSNEENCPTQPMCPQTIKKY